MNTPGDFYCACPHGMMRDPADPKTCINVAGSFDRITELLARYLHANTKNLDTVSSTDEKGGRRYKVPFSFSNSQIRILLQATIKTGDDKQLSIEWSSMPAMVRKALRWLI